MADYGAIAICALCDKPAVADGLYCAECIEFLEMDDGEDFGEWEDDD